MTAFGGNRLIGSDDYDDLTFDSVAPWTPGTPIGWVDGAGSFDSILLFTGEPAQLAGIGGNTVRITIGQQMVDAIRYESLILEDRADTAALFDMVARIEVHGGGGGDLLTGSGAVCFYGDDGDDVFRIAATSGAATAGVVVGGSGSDLLVLGPGVSLDLGRGEARGGSSLYSVSEVESVRVQLAGIVGNVTGDEAANRFSVDADTDDGRAGVIFNGQGGDDWFTGSRADDLLDGGTGHDVLTLASTYRQVAVSTTDGVTTLRGPEGVDSIRGIEDVHFADGTLVIDPDSIGAEIQRLYLATLGRAADQDGLEYWLDGVHDRGLTIGDVATAALYSPEFQASGIDVSTNGAFVDYLYAKILGRDADPDGHAFWTDRLDAGLARSDALLLFSESPEFRTQTAELIGQGYFETDDDYQTVALLYDGAFNRSPDAGGLIYWAEQLKGGTSMAEIANAFVYSSEFQTAIAGKDAGGIVDFFYENTLGRDPDPAGRAYHVGRLEQGLTIGNLLSDFALSPEHQQMMTPQLVGGIEILA